MGRISGNGITVTLYERTQTGTDAFNHPVYTEIPASVSNVLVGEPTAQDVIDIEALTGRKLAYTLAIPKGDAHDWTAGTKVSFFGEDFRTFGDVVQGIEDLIPLDWNKKVKVERYE